MEIRLAQPGDLTGWLQLVEPMRRLFPGLETPESMEGSARDIAGAISRQEALCAEDPTRPVRLITYREGIPEGEAARALYQELGFCPGELVEVEGSPAQEFLRPADNSERSVSE